MVKRYTDKQGIAVHKQVIFSQTKATAKYGSLSKTVTFNMDGNFHYEIIFDHNAHVDKDGVFNWVIYSSESRTFIISGIIKVEGKPAVNTPIQLAGYLCKLKDVMETVTDDDGRFKFTVTVNNFNKPYIYQLAFKNFSGGYEWRKYLVLKHWKLPIILCPHEKTDYYKGNTEGFTISAIVAPSANRSNPKSVEDYFACLAVSFAYKKRGLQDNTFLSLYGETWLIVLADKKLDIEYSLKSPNTTFECCQWLTEFIKSRDIYNHVYTLDMYVYHNGLRIFHNVYCDQNQEVAIEQSIQYTNPFSGEKVSKSVMFPTIALRNYQ